MLFPLWIRSDIWQVQQETWLALAVVGTLSSHDTSPLCSATVVSLMYRLGQAIVLRVSNTNLDTVNTHNQWTLSKESYS